GGESHGPSVRVDIEGVPEGTVIDYRELDDFLRRRSALNEDTEELTTSRKEPDEVIWREGVVNFGGEFGIVTKPVIKAEVMNIDVDPSAYEDLKYIPRPGHADFTAMMKDGIETDTSGGGRFSGRMTVGLCIAGGIIKQLLAKEGIEIMSDITEVGGEEDPMGFEDMVGAAKARGDSVGGVIECGIMGVRAGSCGDAYFDGLEGYISRAVFGIPAVKGIEFGSGFRGAKMLGSMNNDPFVIDEEGEVRTSSNNHGGILGGIASGMPIVFRAAIKPTPSIAKKQWSVNMKTREPVEIEIKGRHDPCIVYRALPCVEAAAAIAIYDALLDARGGLERSSETGSANSEEHKEPVTIADFRKVIDEQDELILRALRKRMEAVKKIGKIKLEKGLPVLDEGREAQILEGKEDFEKEVLAKIMEVSRREEEAPFGLLGRKLSHSLSPELHELIGEETGHKYGYALFEKEPEELENFIRNGSWAGLNVTIPYKQEVIKYLDELSPEAEAIGAVNTIVRRNGKLKGFNTDYFGFKKMIEKKGVDISGRKCLVLGNGGASKAVTQVLFDKGASEVHVLSHNAITEGKALKDNRDCEIIVNTTPVGMYPETGVSAVNPGSFPKLRWAVDVIYNPLRTNFVIQAQKSLIDAIGGLEMLVYQGIYSSMLFTTLSFGDKDAIAEKVASEIKKNQENIVLIGMPGVGKSHIGQKLADEL
ncbi:MAG: chorismate synthase, partial [Clostridiales bacterium]|nr:chorismate synthase [Clostridiales bacterium]